MAFRGITNNEARINELGKQIRNANNAQSQALSNLQGARAGYDAASNRQQQSTLGSVLAGIGNSIKNIGDTAWLATNDVINGWRDIAAGKSTSAEDSYTQQARKKILGGENAKERYGMAGGKALDAAVTLSDLIPAVGANPLANVAQGALSGVAQAKIDNPNATGDELFNNALVGGASGAAGLAAGKTLGKLGGKFGKVGKIANSQLGRGAIGGAAAGATGAGLATALNGGDLGQALSNALQGAKGGALGGAAVAGTLGLAGTAYDKLKNRALSSQNGAGAVVAPTMADLPTTLQKTAQNVADAPEAQVIRRNIPITDYDTGAENIPVNVKRTQNGRGRYIDGYVQGENLPEGALRTQKGYIDDIVRGKNLPESQLPTNDRLIAKLFGIEDGDNRLAEAIARGEIGDATDTLDYLNGVAPRDINKIREGAIDYWNDTHDEGVFGAYKNKSDLPKIDLDDYKDYWLGRYGIERSDIEPELLPFVEQGGRKLGSSEWGDIGLKSGEYTPDDILDKYREFANTDMRRRYFTNENIGGALASDKDLANRVSEAVINDNNMRKNIDVNAGPSRADQIEVMTPAPEQTTSVEPTYTKRILNADTQADNLPAQKQAQEIAKAQERAIAQQQPQISHADRARLERAVTENRQKLGGELLTQYGALDRPARRSVGGDAAGVLADLYDNYGLITPAEVQYAGNHVTGQDGVVSKWTRELAGKAEAVDTAINQKWLENVMEYTGLDDAEKKTVIKQVKAAMQRTGANGYSDGNTALDTVKQIEGQIRQYKGENGTYHNMNESDRKKVLVLNDVKNELEMRIWDAAGDASQVLTPERLAELKEYYAGNEKWANFVDNGLANAKTGKDMRALMKPLVNGSKIVNGSNMSAGSFADNAIANMTGTSKSNITGAIFKAAKDKITNSPKAIQKRAEKYALNASNAQAQLDGNAPLTNKGKTMQAITGTARNIAEKAGNKLENIARPLNNTTISNASYADTLPTFGEVANRQIARQAGLNEGQMATNRLGVQNAITGYENAANDYLTADAQSQALRAQIPQPTAQTQTQTQDPLTRISNAMDLAMSAGDMDSWSKLASLYQTAYKIYAPAEETATEAKDLTANQSKALTGLNQLEQLEQMTPGVRTALSGTPLKGIVDLTGGDEYTNQAQSLALTLGYLQSGANITPREAEKIGQSYVPSAYDSDEVRQQKLARARQLLQNYLGDTNSLQR